MHPYADMVRMIFIKEVITMLKEPKLCPTCQRDDRLDRNILLKEERSNGKTILCTRCEALVVVTNYKLNQVELSSPREDYNYVKRTSFDKNGQVLVFCSLFSCSMTYPRTFANSHSRKFAALHSSLIISPASPLLQIWRCRSYT